MAAAAEEEALVRGEQRVELDGAWEAAAGTVGGRMTPSTSSCSSAMGGGGAAESKEEA